MNETDDSPATTAARGMKKSDVDVDVDVERGGVGGAPLNIPALFAFDPVLDHSTSGIHSRFVYLFINNIAI